MSVLHMLMAAARNAAAAPPPSPGTLAIRQQKATAGWTYGTSCSVTLDQPTLAGSVLWVLAYNNDSARLLSTLSDDKAGVYTTIATNTEAGRLDSVFCKVATGTSIVGAVYDQDENCAIYVAEITGLDLTTPFDVGNIGIYNDASTTGSGTALTNTVNPGFHTAVYYNTQGIAGAAGSGFTPLSGFWNQDGAGVQAVLEYRSITGTGSQNATFTTPAYERHLVAQAIWKPAA